MDESFNKKPLSGLQEDKKQPVVCRQGKMNYSLRERKWNNPDLDTEAAKGMILCGTPNKVLTISRRHFLNQLVKTLSKGILTWA